MPFDQVESPGNLFSRATQPVEVSQPQVEAGSGADYWHGETELSPGQTHGWLAFADPFSFDAETWVRQWNDAYPAQPIAGG